MFVMKTEPFPHQAEWFDHTKDLTAWGLLWEQGTGKTKPTLDTAAYLYHKSVIDTLLIVAPSGVHRRWISDQIPAHLPECGDVWTFSWSGQKSSTQKHALAAAIAQRHKGGLLCVAISYDSLMTDRGGDFVKGLLTKRKCLYVLDESDNVKSPKAKRTIRVLASSKYAVYRRILTGTLVDESPFDVYSQLKFLDSGIWEKIGCKGFAAFKSFFGIFEERRIGGQDGRAYPQLISYRNLELLKGVISSTSNRVTKNGTLKLPPKLYQKRYFSMTAEQCRVYENLKNEYESTIHSGETITAVLAMVRLTRFQQITSGFVPTTATVDWGDKITANYDPEDLEEFYTDILETKSNLVKNEFLNLHPDASNPRLECLREILEQTNGQLIIWAKFTRDIDLICDLLGQMKITFARYDGKVAPDDRHREEDRFHSGEARAFVSKASVGGAGLTLIEARTVIYYNNTFRLKHRLQSEDRAHRLGQDNQVLYIDIVAEDTVDEKILNALRTKRRIASEVNGDNLAEWV